MRKSVLHWESSPCRLLPLLLVVLLSIIGVHSVHGSFGNKKVFNITKDLLQSSEGVSRESHYRLFNRCSEKLVQIRPGGRMKRKGGKIKGSRKGRVDAKAKKHNRYSQLVFQSHNGGSIYIKSHYLKRYLCFNKRGKIVLKPHIHKNDLCLFKQKLTPEGYNEFWSVANPQWFLGFNKRGKKLPQWQRLNQKKQKCFHFMVIKEIPYDQNFSPLYKTNLRNIGLVSSKKR